MGSFLCLADGIVSLYPLAGDGVGRFLPAYDQEALYEKDYYYMPSRPSSVGLL